MADPFFRGANRVDVLLSVLLSKAIDYGTPNTAETFFSAIEPSSARFFPSGADGLPSNAVLVSPSYVVVVIQGTLNLWQWVGNVLGSVQAPVAGWAGAVSQYFAKVSREVYNRSRSYILDNLPGRKLVLVGFSLGGIAATMLGPLLAADGVGGYSCFAVASPRGGDPIFAASIPSLNFVRVSLLYDPIPGMPPPTWTGTGSYRIPVAFPPLCTYQHALPGWTLHTDGSFVQGDPDLSLPETWDQLVNGSPGLYHNWDTYARSLRLGLPRVLDRSNTGYTDPAVIDAQAKEFVNARGLGWPWGETPQPASPFEPNQGGSNVLRATFFFEQGKYGWSESVLNSGSDYEAVLKTAILLAKARLGFAMDTVKINWIRISDPTVKRDAKVVEYSDDFGVVGGIKSSQYQAAPDYSAILLRLVAGNSLWGHMFIRGYPAKVVDGETVKPQNAGFQSPYTAWVANLLSASNGWMLRNTTRGLNPTLPATLFTPTPPRGFSCVVDGVGLGFAAGNNFRVSGIDERTAAGYNGTKTLLAFSEAAGPPAKTTLFFGGAAPIGSSAAGFVRKLDYVTNAIKEVQILRPTHRPAGRPFDLRHGRRSNRIPLRQ